MPSKLTFIPTRCRRTSFGSPLTVQTTLVNLHVRSLPNLVAGDYFLRATITDPAHAVRTVSTAQTVHIDAPYVVLTVDFSRPPTPATMHAGRAGHFFLTVNNELNVAAIGKLTASLTTTPDNPTNSVPVPAMSKHINVAVGRTSKINFGLRIPRALPPGIYYLVVHFASDNSFVAVDPADFVIRSPIMVG